MSAGDALCFALNIAPPNSINPCSFFFFFPPPSTCLSFTRPLFPRVFSDAIFNPWKDECGEGKIESLESATVFFFFFSLNAVTSSECVRVGRDGINLGVRECDCV